MSSPDLGVARSDAGDLQGPTGRDLPASSPGGTLADEPPPTILVIDNYDSFAYNIVQYVGEVVLGMGGDDEQVLVRRNDAIDVEGISRLAPDGIVVSPGPGTPQDAGVSMPIFAELSIPTLGVCLGHQALCAANGARVGQAEAVVHGKSSTISHTGRGLFAGLPDPIEGGRYHSLAVRREDLPAVLAETARTDDEVEVVMGVCHESAPHYGVQFHPESILTEYGLALVANFLEECA